MVFEEITISIRPTSHGGFMGTLTGNIYAISARVNGTLYTVSEVIIRDDFDTNFDLAADYCKEKLKDYIKRGGDDG